MAKVNFQLQKRQKEAARKLRQTERLNRRGEQPTDVATPVASPPVVKSPGETP